MNKKIDQLCIDTIRTLSMDAVQAANCGHPGAPMGMAAAMYCLWDRFLLHDPSAPDFENRDRFVLSMGHASMLLYSTLHLSGYEISLEDLKRFRQLHGKCAGHPEFGLISGVEATTGPLGQGLGNSVGMAIAERWLEGYFNRGSHEIVKYQVYAFCSDGDLMEGVSSESASLAAHLGLGNLIWIYDDNKISIDGDTRITFSENVGSRFVGYGWRVLNVADANNVDEIHVAIESAIAESERPTLIVVKSQIGFGSPNRAGTAKAHGEPLGADEVRLTKEAYGWDPDATFHVPEEVSAHMRDAAIRRGNDLSRDWRARFEVYAEEYPELAREWAIMQRGELPEDWERDLPEFDADSKGLATRASSAKALDAVSANIPWMMGGAADLATSTKTIIPGSGLFQKDNRSGRNIAFGVREHAMAAIVNGLTLSKIRAFGSSFLVFTDYCRPSIRLAALSGLPSLFVFTHDSVALGEDGPTHQPIEHLASLRAMPNIDVIRPCDANEVSVMWRHVMSLKDRPALLALTRQAVPTLDRSRLAAASGALLGGYVLAECDGNCDLILIGTGSEVQYCVGAWEQLSSEGVGVRVVSLPCWELFDRQEQAYRDSVLPSDVLARVSVEAGSTLGWSKYVGSGGTSIGIDRYGESAPFADLMKEFGFTVANVVNAARRQLERSTNARKSEHATIGATPEAEATPNSQSA